MPRRTRLHQALMVAIAAGAIGPALTRARANVPQDLLTTQAELGHLAGGLAIMISPDSAHLAFITNAGPLSIADRKSYDPAHATTKAIRLVIDGKPTVASEKITTPLYSADSRHIAYAIKVADKWHIVEDDKTLIDDADNIPGFQGRGDPIVFSPDSQHVATLVEKDFHWHVAVDGKEWPIITTPECGELSFSPDSQHVAIVARTKNTAMLYVDGQKLPPPAGHGGPEGPPLERMFATYSWSPDAHAIAFAGAFPQNKWQVFVVPTPNAPPTVATLASRPFDGVLPGTPIFSFNSHRFAFVTKEKGKWIIGTDRDESPPMKEIYGPALTFLAPDKSAKPPGTPTSTTDRLVYIAAKGPNGPPDAWNLYIDHQPIGPGYQAFLKDTFTVSPDHEHYAVVAVRNNKAVLIRDGKELGTFDVVGPNTLAFSPDSQHLACAVSVNRRWHVWIDGRLGAADFFAMHELPIAFSPDSQQVAFTAELNHGVSRVYVGPDAAYQSKFYDTILKGAAVHWQGPHTLTTIAVTRMIAYRLTLQIPK